MDTSTGSIGSGLLWCLIGAVCLGTAGFFFFRKKYRKKLLDFSVLGQMITFPQPRLVDEITMREIIAYFKRPEIFALLQDNPDLLAVAIQDRKEQYIDIALCVFNQGAGEVEKIELLRAPRMDESASAHFGEKDMLVLK